tara:strand:- start:111 stop:359 length:249 start_codon:yes stop_codon:yes gene_type:complete
MSENAALIALLVFLIIYTWFLEYRADEPNDSTGIEKRAIKDERERRLQWDFGFSRSLVHINWKLWLVNVQLFIIMVILLVKL